MTTVVLLRHGRTQANATGVLAGRSSGVQLDEAGHAGAQAAAARLAGVPLAAVVSSPLRRCRQTASALTAQHPERQVVIDSGLVECDYGDWTGRKIAELHQDPLWQLVQTQPSAVRFPSGEAMGEMASRAWQCVLGWNVKLGAVNPQAVWVAVSHGDVIKALLATALGMHLDSFQRILIDPASISIVRLQPARPFVVTMNSVAGDLKQLLATPAAKSRGRRGKTRPDEAVIGGGLGAGE